jgi:hypothetical protein
MASMPASAASLASSTVWMPLMTSGPSHTERIHSMSRHDRPGSNCVLTYSDSVTAALPSPTPMVSFTLAALALDPGLDALQPIDRVDAHWSLR